MKNLIILLICLICLTGCATNHNHILSQGYDHNIFQHKLNIITELRNHDLLLSIYNIKRINYKLVITDDFSCEKSSGYLVNTIYEGNDLQKDIIILIPFDKEKCNSDIHVRVININNNEVIYDSPVLKIKNIKGN